MPGYEKLEIPEDVRRLRTDAQGLAWEQFYREMEEGRAPYGAEFVVDPEEIFNKSMDPAVVIDFIESNWDLEGTTRK